LRREPALLKTLRELEGSKTEGLVEGVRRGRGAFPPPPARLGCRSGANLPEAGIILEEQKWIKTSVLE
jgi:hypothetical protein